MTLRLFHAGTQTSFELPPKSGVVLLGKTCDDITPDIDLSALPASDVISRRHAQIYIQNDKYYLEDLGSSNGTYLNLQRLQPHTHYHLTAGDQISLGQGDAPCLTFEASATANNGGIPKTSTTRMQTPAASSPAGQTTVDATIQQWLGLGVMALAIGLLAARTQIGLWTGLPTIALCLVGFVVLLRSQQDEQNQLLGWGLIIAGGVMLIWQGRFFASVNLLALILNAVVFLFGYQLYSRQPIFNRLIALGRDLFKLG